MSDERQGGRRRSSGQMFPVIRLGIFTCQPGLACDDGAST